MDDGVTKDGRLSNDLWDRTSRISARLNAGWTTGYNTRRPHDLANEYRLLILIGSQDKIM